MLEIQNTIEMKNVFDGLMSRLDTAEKRISELEDISVETNKTEKQREKSLGEGIGRECSRTVGQQQKIEHIHNGNSRRGREKGKEETLNNERIFPKLMLGTKP